MKLTAWWVMKKKIVVLKGLSHDNIFNQLIVDFPGLNNFRGFEIFKFYLLTQKKLNVGPNNQL